jgi:uncharacterized protein
VEVTWDPAKNASNQRRHGLTFEEAAVLFTSGVDYLEVFDSAHSDIEDRFLAIGPVGRGLIVVVHTVQLEDTIRIISARMATKTEQSLFSSYLTGIDD